MKCCLDGGMKWYWKWPSWCYKWFCYVVVDSGGAVELRLIQDTDECSCLLILFKIYHLVTSSTFSTAGWLCGTSSKNVMAKNWDGNA